MIVTESHPSPDTAIQDPPAAVAKAGANPLSPSSLRLNGHVGYVDPLLAVSFPTAMTPDPITDIDSLMGDGTKSAVRGRAANVCFFCGLRSAKYQRVVGPLSAVIAAEARLACIFCAQVMALDQASSFNSGVLVYVPELGQAELNAYARIIYVTRVSQGQVANDARSALDVIMGRRLPAKRQLGTDDPYHLASMLAGCRTGADVHALTGRLDGIRLFPLDRRNISEGELKFNQFPQILAYYRSKDGPFGAVPPGQLDLTEFNMRVRSIGTAR